MKLKYYGHSCFGLETEKASLLFDPFITPNALAENVDVDQIEADFILVSHGHEDHVADVERIAARTGAIIVSNFEIVSWFESKGLKNGHPMNIGGEKEFDFGRVKYVNAIHSSVLPDGAYGGNPGGWIVQVENKTIYYAGDTALTMDMKLLAKYNLDLAILPIGDNFTMGAEDAIECSKFIDCKKIVGMHFDTFPYIKIDHEQIIEKFKTAGLNLHLPTINSIIEI